jgi:hypothetical protein
VTAIEKWKVAWAVVAFKNPEKDRSSSITNKFMYVGK